MRSVLLPILFFMLVSSTPGHAYRPPILLIDRSTSDPSIGAGGLSFKYKRASGPLGFGGDMLVWGGRMYGGKLRDPKFGLMGQLGTLNGNALRLNLRMGGFSVEDGFKPDPRFKWRANFGFGTYDLESRITFRTINKGGFAFFEPMLVGVLPMKRHIVLEIGAGYTFCGALGVRIEGLFLQVDLLLGRF